MASKGKAIQCLANEYLDNERQRAKRRARNVNIILTLRDRYGLGLQQIGALLGKSRQAIYKIITDNS